MMASFVTIYTFSERGEANGALLPLHGAQASYNVITIPGGTKVYLQVGIPKKVRLTIPARVTRGELNGLRSVRGLSDSLVYAGGDVNATLEEVSPVLVKAGADVYFVNLTFVI